MKEVVGSTAISQQTTAAGRTSRPVASWLCSPTPCFSAKFIGGGFAGQVYRVIVKSLSGPCGGLEIGKRYAMKILVPPSRGSKVFRDAVYMIGFQGSFSPQVNVSAARAGALWQKFIRRAAALRFGSERTVKDIHATFVDSTIGSCGEISEWVEGRNWRFECDDGLDTRSRRDLWEIIRSLAQAGTTVFLTTQYLEEAEQLADRIAILHEGRIIAHGTLADLKALLPPVEVEYVEKQPTLEEVFLAITGNGAAGRNAA